MLKKSSAVHHSIAVAAPRFEKTPDMLREFISAATSGICFWVDIFLATRHVDIVIQHWNRNLVDRLIEFNIRIEFELEEAPNPTLDLYFLLHEASIQLQGWFVVGFLSMEIRAQLQKWFWVWMCDPVVVQQLINCLSPLVLVCMWRLRPQLWSGYKSGKYSRRGAIGLIQKTTWKTTCWI